MLRKIMFIAIAALIFTSCGLYNSASINDLQLGTTKQQIDAQFGYPLRMLSMGNVGGAYSEVYEYKIRSSVYALEYVSNRLNFVELLYEYDEYYPPNPSPDYRPVRPPGNSGRPDKPGNGGGNTRPPANSGGINRPPSNRPDGSNNQGRPPMDQSKPSEPAKPASPTRPTEPAKPASPAKPAEPTKPESGSNRPTTGRQTGGSRSSSSKSEETNNVSTNSSTDRNTSSGRASSGGSR